jgi:hypothetical protein
VLIVGGDATAYVVVFVIRLDSHRDEEALKRLLTIRSPIGAVVGCIIGALVVHIAEKRDAR